MPRIQSTPTLRAAQRSSHYSSSYYQSNNKWHTSTIRCLITSSILFILIIWILAILGLDSSNEGDGNIIEIEDIPPADTNIQQIIDANNNQLQLHAHSNSHSHSHHGTIPTPRATIAYAVSLTSCGISTDRHDNIKNGGHSSDPSFHEGAAVLKHSIHLASVRNYHVSKSLFDYEMIAFVHPNAESCSHIFSELGYTIQIRETPFNVTDIRGEFLREHVVKSGCCGEKEYLKLYAYTLLEYPIVIHLDLDSLILRPLDDLFVAMLGTNGGGHTRDVKEARSRISVMFNNALPESKDLDAYFTRDYNMINPGHKHVGVQGGFLIVKPNMDAFHEYVSIVLEGKFFQGSGWEGKGYGGYFGAQQIQGICSYYYDYKHPGTGVELNRCYYNAMADSARQSSSGKCRDGRDDCQDCTITPIEDVKSVHFTLCSKPWKCPGGTTGNSNTKTICAKFHAEWFRIREHLERKTAMEEGREYSNPGGSYKPEIFHGYCKSNGERGYIPLRQQFSVTIP